MKQPDWMDRLRKTSPHLAEVAAQDYDHSLDKERYWAMATDWVCNMTAPEPKKGEP